MSNILNEEVVVPVRSTTTPLFRKTLSGLPPHIRQIVEEKYKRWRKNPQSVNFERKWSNYYVVEIARKYHAICRVDGAVGGYDVCWLWVGIYDAYLYYINHTLRHEKPS